MRHLYLGVYSKGLLEDNDSLETNRVTKLFFKIALQNYHLLFQWAEEDALNKSILDPWT